MVLAHSSLGDSCATWGNLPRVVFRKADPQSTVKVFSISAQQDFMANAGRFSLQITPYVQTWRTKVNKRTSVMSVSDGISATSTWARPSMINKLLSPILTNCEWPWAGTHDQLTSVIQSIWLQTQDGAETTIITAHGSLDTETPCLFL